MRSLLKKSAVKHIVSELYIISISKNCILTSNVDFGDSHAMETNFPSWRKNENKREARHIMIALSRLLDMLRDPSFIAFKASATSITGYEEYPYRTTRSPQRYRESTIYNRT